MGEWLDRYHVGLAVVAVIVGITLLPRLSPRGVGGDRWRQIAFLVSAAGVWAAVPDTEPILALAGLLAPACLVAAFGESRDGVDALPAVAVIVGASILGTGGRNSWIGGIGCLAVLAYWPLVGRRPRRPWWLFAVHVAAVVVSARVATRLATPPAVGLVIVVFAVSGVAVAFTRPSPGPSRRGSAAVPRS
jgi:hypothetical protein